MRARGNPRRGGFFWGVVAGVEKEEEAGMGAGAEAEEEWVASAS